MLIYDTERPEILLALTENRINHCPVKVAVTSSEFLAAWLLYNLLSENDFCSYRGFFCPKKNTLCVRYKMFCYWKVFLSSVCVFFVSKHFFNVK